jgi:hypothetical protein
VTTRNVSRGTDAFVANSAPDALRHWTQWQRAIKESGPSAS